MSYEVRHNASEEIYVWEVVEVATGNVVHASRDDDKYIADRICELRNVK